MLRHRLAWWGLLAALALLMGAAVALWLGPTYPAAGIKAGMTRAEVNARLGQECHPAASWLVGQPCCRYHLSYILPRWYVQVETTWDGTVIRVTESRAYDPPDTWRGRLRGWFRW
jgi:hypothetical protein